MAQNCSRNGREISAATASGTKLKGDHVESEDNIDSDDGLDELDEDGAKSDDDCTKSENDDSDDNSEGVGGRWNRRTSQQTRKNGTKRLRFLVTPNDNYTGDPVTDEDINRNSTRHPRARYYDNHTSEDETEDASMSIAQAKARALPKKTAPLDEENEVETSRKHPRGLHDQSNSNRTGTKPGIPHSRHPEDRARRTSLRNSGQKGANVEQRRSRHTSLRGEGQNASDDQGKSRRASLRSSAQKGNHIRHFLSHLKLFGKCNIITMLAEFSIRQHSVSKDMRLSLKVEQDWSHH
ncbi:uncharacterized protein EI90DRAFT_3026602 [Cantharellus anzutake]|uniref:uncharacterized protein n=1 Tax=Cantharellus anzutake TaxID=1750568 RepID=UPI0019079352|nr:uncharacterized protein EI90DRAFT_3026602 [Cantharellus anzutake]KAF8306861.1 hypothetical protein EI90DRAFT_3026602 [Cantharellus anzutake]